MQKLPVYLFSLSSHPEAHSIASLDITLFRPEIDFENRDALILTSKQAVNALKQYEKKHYVHLPALCISKATAKAYEELGGTVLRTGSGYGDTLKEHIKAYPVSKRWLYLRAKTIASDFAAQLRKEGYDIQEAIVYASECSQALLQADIPKRAILIFTSPSSVECYLKNHSIEESHEVIVIGKTTAKALPKNTRCVISPETSIESCMQIARKLHL